MSFNTLTFLLFIVVVFAVYFSSGIPWQAKKWFLVCASYLFYGWWDLRFVPLLAFSTASNFFFQRKIYWASSPVWRKRFLLMSLGCDLGLLFIFKYMNFFSANVFGVLGTFGLPISRFITHIALPIGISFYTFETVCYTVDIYQKRCSPHHSFLDFALFVAFFPKLVAGPIVRAARFLPKLTRPPILRDRSLLLGFHLVLLGLFKKMVIADNLAPYVNEFFQHKQMGFVNTWEAAYAFAGQIYGDFAGYSLVAVGLCFMMGLKVNRNFNYPYIAVNFSDFWKRWNISLSSWITDYIYKPLGGSRVSPLLTYRNVFIAMVLSGLWHGAAWTFVAWGFFHASLIAGQRLTSRWRLWHPITGWQRLISALVVFHVGCFGWILFRAQTIGQAFLFIRSMIHPAVSGHLHYGLWLCLAAVGLEHVLEFVGVRHMERRVLSWPLCTAYFAVLMFVIVHFRGAGQQFIYFQF
jgi:alginate O-acetyltransferase complex protein AlgI